MEFRTITLASEDGKSTIEVRVPTSPLPTTARVAALKDAFDRMCDPIDWKKRIDATLSFPSAALASEGLATAIDAIEFYTATTPTVTLLGEGRFRLQADGYYAGPAN